MNKSSLAATLTELPAARKRGGLGFTLVELLVVVAIIGLLVMLFIPNMRGVIAKARTVQCANKLREIGKAAHGRKAEGKEVNELMEFGWPRQIADYLGGSECLICPEATRIFVASGYVEESIEIKSGNRGIPFIPGPRVIKLSDTQWGSAGIRETARRNPPTYAPDGSGIYWWGWEDGSDFDFQDMAVKVSTHVDGSHTVWCQSWTSGSPEIWTMDHSEILAYHREINKYYFPHTNGKTLEAFYFGGECTYGMNRAMLELRHPGKVLALDYGAVAAYSTDIWTDEKWDEDQNGLPDFARHERKINVLLVIGGVELKSIDEINPAAVSVGDEWWDP